MVENHIKSRLEGIVNEYFNTDVKRISSRLEELSLTFVSEDDLCRTLEHLLYLRVSEIKTEITF